MLGLISAFELLDQAASYFPQSWVKKIDLQHCAERAESHDTASEPRGSGSVLGHFDHSVLLFQRSELLFYSFPWDIRNFVKLSM